MPAKLSKADDLASKYGRTTEEGMDVMMITLAIAQAWVNTAPDIRNPARQDLTGRLQRHRAAVVRATATVVQTLLD